MKYLSIIILALAIYFGAAKIGDGLVAQAQMDQQLNIDRQLSGNKVSLKGELGSAVPVNITSNSADFSYHSKLTIAEGEKLSVSKNGKVEIIEGSNIEARYYHHGKLMIIEYIDSDSVKIFRYINNPDSWVNVD